MNSVPVQSDHKDMLLLLKHWRTSHGLAFYTHTMWVLLQLNQWAQQARAMGPNFFLFEGPSDCYLGKFLKLIMLFMWCCYCHTFTNTSSSRAKNLFFLSAFNNNNFSILSLVCVFLRTV